MQYRVGFFINGYIGIEVEANSIEEAIKNASWKNIELDELKDCELVPYVVFDENCDVVWED